MGMGLKIGGRKESEHVNDLWADPIIIYTNTKIHGIKQGVISRSFWAECIHPEYLASSCSLGSSNLFSFLLVEIAIS